MPSTAVQALQAAQSRTGRESITNGQATRYTPSGEREVQTAPVRSTNTTTTSTRKRRVEEEAESSDATTGGTDNHMAQPASKKRKPGRPAKQVLHDESDLPLVTMGITTEHGIDRIQEIRSSFYRALVSQMSATESDRQNALEFTDFFFNDVMGRSSVDRITKLINSYSPSTDELNDMGVIARVRALTHDKAAPEPVRLLFSAYYMQQSTSRPANASADHLVQLTHALALLTQYRKVSNLIENRDYSIIKFLVDQGYGTERGCDWRTAGISCLSKLARLDRQVFINTCEKAKSVERLVFIYGHGILPLLPPGTMSRSVIHRQRRYKSY